MFQAAIVPYEKEFSADNPPRDIEPYNQYYEWKQGQWYCKSCGKWMDLKHATCPKHKRYIEWYKQEQQAHMLGILPMPPQLPWVPDRQPTFEIPPALPATSGQNEAQLSGHIEWQSVQIAQQSEQIEKQTEVIKKLFEQIEQQTELIKKQCELYKSLTENQAQLMKEIAAMSDNMKQLAASVGELKSWITEDYDF